jgi:hypothetical protein
VKQPIAFAIYPRVYRACVVTTWDQCDHETLERGSDESCPWCASNMGDPGDEDDGRAERTRAERLQMAAYYLRVAIERAYVAFMAADTEVRHTPKATALRIKIDRQRAWLNILDAKIWIASVSERPILAPCLRRNYAALTREVRS